MLCYLLGPDNSQKIIPSNNSHSFPRIFLFNLSLRFIFRFRRFHEVLLSKKDRALRAFHPTIPFTSLPPSLSLYIFPSTFLSLSLLFIILFGVSNGRFRPCSSISYSLLCHNKLGKIFFL